LGDFGVIALFNRIYLLENKEKIMHERPKIKLHAFIINDFKEVSNEGNT